MTRLTHALYTYACWILFLGSVVATGVFLGWCAVRFVEGLAK